MSWPTLYAHGATHGGVVSRRCAPTSGVAPTSLRRRAEREDWERPFPGTYVLPGIRPTGVTRAVAAALWAGERATLTGASALAVHGFLRTAPTTVELVVARDQRPLEHPRIRTRWTTGLPSEAVRRVHGVNVADPARSLADHAETATLPRLRALGLDAWTQGALSTSAVERELDARGRFPGRGRYRQLLADLRGDGSESGFEFETRARLGELGLRPDPDQIEVVTPAGIRRIDIAFPGREVGIECLGFGCHSSPADLERDAVRSNAIATLDRWLVFRLTLRMFHLRWDEFVAHLRAGIARRAPR
jgi:hypothetical protein